MDTKRMETKKAIIFLLMVASCFGASDIE
ncbi:hypothetical protein LCGC14_2300280, partial [marine sediment metagenome]